MRQGFLYQEGYSRTEELPKPAEEHEGAFWKEDIYCGLNGWGLYEKACVDSDRAQHPESYPGQYRPPEKCRVKFVPYKQYIQYEWKQSVSDYYRESFDSMYNYFWFNVPALIALILGGFMYSGWADSVLSWIRSGNAKS